MKLSTAVIVSLVIIGISLFLVNNKNNTNLNNQSEKINNVTVVDGKQIIEIKAKGGYLPQRSIAKAGIPTILRINTSGTFDCSAALRIPSKNINEMLPNSGTTDIDLGTNEVSTLNGMCGMGMYSFVIDFKS